MGAGDERGGYGGAPVDDGAEDIEEEGFGRVGEGHGRRASGGKGAGLLGRADCWLRGREHDAAVRGQPYAIMAGTPRLREAVRGRHESLASECSSDSFTLVIRDCLFRTNVES